MQANDGCLVGRLRDSTLDAALLSAAYKGNLDELSHMLQAGADPDTRGASGVTPLIACAYRSNLTRDTGGHMRCAQALLKAGAKVDVTCDLGYTALFYAARISRSDMCAMLIKNGADIRHRNPHGASILHLAARDTSKDVYAQLIAWGADVNAVANAETASGESVICSVCRIGDLTKARLLIEAGAHLDAPFPGAKSALALAIRSGDPDLLRLILDQKPDLESADRSGYTPLMHAAETGYEHVAMLLESGTSPHGPSGEMAAVIAGNRRFASAVNALRIARAQDSAQDSFQEPATEDLGLVMRSNP